MSTELTLDEIEKIENLKAFWKDHRAKILVGLALIVVSATSVGWWKQHQYRQNVEAASLYASIQGMQQIGQPAAVATLTDTLLKRYPGTAYAARGALIGASAASQAHNISLAQTDLQWILDHSKESGLQTVARLRLAGLLLDTGKLREALALLDAPHDESSADVYNDLKGDVLVRLGQLDAARAAWRIALEKLPPDSPFRQVIEIKLNAIAGVAAK